MDCVDKTGTNNCWPIITYEGESFYRICAYIEGDYISQCLHIDSGQFANIRTGWCIKSQEGFVTTVMSLPDHTETGISVFSSVINDDDDELRLIVLNTSANVLTINDGDEIGAITVVKRCDNI